MDKQSDNRVLIKREESLWKFIDEKITTKIEREITIVCAGHFMLLPNKEHDKVIAGVFEGERDEYYEHAQSVIGIFPQYTWKVGCKIVKRIKKVGHSAKLSLLVNDWQLVPVDENREESKPNRFRDAFYKEFKELPLLYKREFDSCDLNYSTDIYQTEDKEFFLREVRLRDRFMRKLKNFVVKDTSVPVGMCKLSLDECGNITLDRENKPAYSLTFNWQTGCAGGVAQMITDITRHLGNSYDRVNFINLMPKGCTVPVNTASELAIDLMIKEGIGEIPVSIVNIYFEGNGTLEEEDFYEDYGRNVTCYEFKSTNNEQKTIA